MSDLVLAIRLTADGNGLRGELRLAQEDLEKLGKGAGNAADGLEETGRASEFAERTVSSLRTAAITLAAAIGEALTGAIVAANRGLQDFAQAERLGLRLEQVFRATGGAAGVAAGEIQELGDAIEVATFATAEEVLEAAAVLGTFRQISGDTFKRTLVLAQDLAAVFGQSLAGSATQLGKALEDPIEGISALSRVGVTFNDVQKEMIAELVRLGDVAGAQTIVLDTLEQQVGGAGAAEAGGLAGAFNLASDAVGNLLEAFGELLDRELGITQSVRTIAGALTELAIAAGGDGVARLTDGVREGVEKVVALEREIAEAAARGDQSRVERLTSERNAVAEHWKITGDTISQYEEEAAAAARAEQERAEQERQAALNRATRGASDLAAAIQADLQGLATPEEKLAAVNRELEETVNRLNGLKAAGAPAEVVDAAIAAAEERARRESTAITRSLSSGRGGGGREAERLQDYLDKLRFEAELLGQSAEQQAVYNALRQAGLDTTTLLVDASGRLLGSYSLEAEEVARLTRETLAKNAAERAAGRSQDRQAGLQDQLTLLKAEMDLVGAGNEERELRIALLEKEIELRREGIDLTSQQAEAELDLVEQTVKASQELEGLRDTQDAITRFGERAFDRIGEAITQAFADGSLKALDFGQIAKAVLSELLQEMLRIAVLNPLKKAFSDVLSGIGGWFSGGSSGGVTTTNVTEPGRPIFSLHGGGIAGQGGNAARSVDMAVFASARRYHSGGLLPGEVPAILEQGEEVLTADDPRHRRNGGGQAPKVEVHVHEASGTKATVRERREGGQQRIDVMIDMLDEALAQRAARGDSHMGRSMERLYGLDRGRGALR